MTLPRPVSRVRASPRVQLPPGFGIAALPLPLNFGPHRTTLRQLGPADAERLIAFFRSHTPETIHQRYGYACSEMTPARAAALVGVDQCHDVALGLVAAPGADERILAVGRYCHTADPTTAEVAFVVHESCRGLGIGGVLLQALISIARQQGLRRLLAWVQRDNTPMLAALRRAGAMLQWPEESGELYATLDLTPQPAAVPREGRTARAVSARRRPNAPVRPLRASAPPPPKRRNLPS